MDIEDSQSERGSGEKRQRWREERRRQMQVIEAVLVSGAEQGVFEICHLKTEARILRDMVRSTLLYSRDKLSIDEMVDMIMRIFLKGVWRAD